MALMNTGIRVWRRGRLVCGEYDGRHIVNLVGPVIIRSAGVTRLAGRGLRLGPKGKFEYVYSSAAEALEIYNALRRAIATAEASNDLAILSGKPLRYY